MSEPTKVRIAVAIAHDGSWIAHGGSHLTRAAAEDAAGDELAARERLPSRIEWIEVEVSALRPRATSGRGGWA